jgi:hypothetical protein
MGITYIALETFSKKHKAWNKYVEWSRLHHLKEIISLDIALCSSVLKDLQENDYMHIVHSDHRYIVFDDYVWLNERTRVFDDKQLLAIYHEPDFECKEMDLECQFEFCGYDLVEDATGISALVNCGGFEEAFSPNDLSEVGLISSYEKAREVQTLLTENYPDENHAYCDLWAIWRFIL